jgi:hypothetical protein
MNIARKIIQSVAEATDLKCYYGTRESINEQVSKGGLPCAFFALLEEINIQEGAGTIAKTYTLTISFARLTEFDYESVDNEDIIEHCQLDAFNWLAYIRAGMADFVAGEVVGSGSLYEELDDIITGYYLTIRITTLPQCLQMS